MARRNQPAVGRSLQIIGRRKALDSIYAPKKSPGPATGAFDLNAHAALASMRRDHMTRAATKKILATAQSPGTGCVLAHHSRMRKDDVTCPACKAGYRRIEIVSHSGSAGDVRCPLCDTLLEVIDGTTAIAYRLTVAPEKLSG
jgi:uncharacterized Zn-finger protein